VTDNLIHSLFSQCSVTLNGLTIPQASEHYNYRSYLETLLTYGSDAAASHLTNAYWYLNTCDMQPCRDPMAENLTATGNLGFITRWNKLSASKKIQLFGQLYSDLCNVPLHLVPGDMLQIILTKAPTSFYMMNKATDSKTTFKILDAQLMVRRIRFNPVMLIAHNSTLSKWVSRFELETFTFSARSKSLSIDNAVLGPIPKLLLFTMVKNTDFIGSTQTRANFNIMISAIFRCL